MGETVNGETVEPYFNDCMSAIHLSLTLSFKNPKQHMAVTKTIPNNVDSGFVVHTIVMERNAPATARSTLS